MTEVPKTVSVTCAMGQVGTRLTELLLGHDRHVLAARPDGSVGAP